MAIKRKTKKAARKTKKTAKRKSHKKACKCQGCK
jgi:hypothetical protein